MKADIITCVVGSKGNMGRRYMSILKWLNVNHVGVDIYDKIPRADNYIVATPTKSHVDDIYKIKQINPSARILCEKPISTLHIDVYSLEKWEGTIFMVNNYRYMVAEGRYIGGTLYDYYNSGSDGLEWDCIQLIYLAKKHIELRNDSPRWVCHINGHVLDRASIDNSYIHMVEDFLRDKPKKLWGYKDICAAHEKVLDYKGVYR